MSRRHRLSVISPVLSNPDPERRLWPSLRGPQLVVAALAALLSCHCVLPKYDYDPTQEAGSSSGGAALGGAGAGGGAASGGTASGGSASGGAGTGGSAFNLKECPADDALLDDMEDTPVGLCPRAGRSGEYYVGIVGNSGTTIPANDGAIAYESDSASSSNGVIRFRGDKLDPAAYLGLDIRTTDNEAYDASDYAGFSVRLRQSARSFRPPPKPRRLCTSRWRPSRTAVSEPSAGAGPCSLRAHAASLLVCVRHAARHTG